MFKLRGVYAMMAIRGVVSCYPRGPFVPASSEETRKIERALGEQGVL
jgi:dihydrodipicolinate synthase/N-acetylneuraminate lyase